MNAAFFWPVGLFVAVVLTAAFVNRYAPSDRPRVRRIVTFFGIYLFSLAFEYLLVRLGAPRWASRVNLAADLFRAFTAVSIGSLLVLSVGTKRLGFNIPLIATDLLAGLGYVLSAAGIFADHGFDTSSLLATSAVVSAVLAISLQSTLGNILGGVALQLDGSIEEGDWIQFENGRQGRVCSVRWRHTVVETRDYSTVIVPNAQLLANNILILGKRGGNPVPQRMWVWFNVDFRFAPTKVVSAVQTALRANPIENVATTPPPDCVCMDFAKEPGQTFTSYAVRFWLPDMSRTDSVGSNVRARIFTALQRANIPLALPANVQYLQIEDDARKESKKQRAEIERLAALRSVPLFRPLTEPELVALAGGMHNVIYAAGETITRQGAVAHWLYVMISGRVEIRVKLDADVTTEGRPSQTHVVATLEAPDFFGEMGLMTGEPRYADVVAMSDVECWRLGKQELETILTKRPEIANDLSERLAARRVELIAVREGLDVKAKKARTIRESEHILAGIKQFFGL